MPQSELDEESLCFGKDAKYYMGIEIEERLVRRWARNENE